MLKITVIAMGDKMPGWVIEGTQEYARRFVDGVQLKLIEIPLIKRGKVFDQTRILEKEASQLIAALPVNSYKIALDIQGKGFSSEALAREMQHLQQISSHWCFIIGGPEGLSTEVLALCDTKWSLSALTFPHPVVRILLLESIYRAWSIIHNHPYHK